MRRGTSNKSQMVEGSTELGSEVHRTEENIYPVKFTLEIPLNFGSFCSLIIICLLSIIFVSLSLY